MLIVSVGARVCAIPVDQVAETMRPLPIEPIAGAPAFVLGVAMIRGAATPVVDLGALVTSGTSSATWQRFVTIKVGDRRVAIGVDRVIGLRDVDRISELPPLLRDAGADVIAALGTVDAELLFVLRMARLVPDATWAAIAESR